MKCGTAKANWAESVQGWGEGGIGEIRSDLAFVCLFFRACSVGLNKPLRNHHGKKKQLCIVPGPASFWNTGILRNKLVISCKTMRRKKAPCHLISVFIGRSSQPASDSKPKPSGNVSVGDDHIPGNVTASCSPVGWGLLQALLWLRAGLEEGSHSQSSVCHAVTPLLPVFGPMVNLTSGISPGKCPCCQAVD